MTADTMITLDSKSLGIWTRCIRETSKWSQEALAASASLDVRTIQRIEAGKPTSITTRRALARGLGYEDPNTFEDPDFIRQVCELLDGAQNAAEKNQREKLEKSFPEHMSVSAARVAKGQQLSELANRADGYLCHMDDDILGEAKELAAAIFDYVRDLGDLGEFDSYSQSLSLYRELDSMIATLNELGVSIYVATRLTKLTNDHCAEKKPLRFIFVYVAAISSEKEIDRLMVPRRVFQL